MVDKASGGRTVKKNLRYQYCCEKGGRCTYHQEMAVQTSPWNKDVTSGYRRFNVVLGAQPKTVLRRE
jgi:hypothetical protein